MKEKGAESSQKTGWLGQRSRRVLGWQGGNNQVALDPNWTGQFNGRQKHQVVPQCEGPLMTCKALILARSSKYRLLENNQL